MTVGLIILAFVLIGLLEIPGMIRQRDWTELTVFSLLMIFGLVLSIFEAMNLGVCSPNKPINYLVTQFLSLFK